jgi:RNA polymerase sigma-70 factor (ECF subfamily)
MPEQIADGALDSDLAGLDDPDNEPAEETEKQLLFRRALELVQRDFEERTWQAFWKDGMSPKDAGEELDMKPGTVRVAKSRVLARLRQEFGDLM